MSTSLELRVPRLDQLNGLEPVAAKQRFGGGLCLDSIKFGFITNDVLCLKVDHKKRSELEDTNGGLVTCQRGGKVLVLSYF